MALIWVGQTLSQAGTRMYQIALLWWVVSAGGGGREAGLFMVMISLPALLFVKFIGRTVERAPRRRILVTCDLISGGLIAAVAIALASGTLGFAGVCAAGFCVAASQAFFEPALNKAVGELVAPEDVEEAVALQASTQSLASFGGAAAGALLIDHIGVQGVVALNVGSFLVSAVLNAMLRFPAAASAPDSAGEAGAAGAWELLRETPWLKKALLGFGCANFFLTPVLVVMPLYVQRSLGGGASLLGTLEAALWLGLVLGSALSKRIAVQNEAALAALSLGLAAACLILPGMLVGAPLLLAALLALGTAMGINNVKFVALFQETVRPEHKGRFFALMQALLSVTFPAAFFLFGLLADRLAPPRVLVVQGLGLLAVAAYFAKLATELAPRLPRASADAGGAHAG